MKRVSDFGNRRQYFLAKLHSVGNRIMDLYCFTLKSLTFVCSILSTIITISIKYPVSSVNTKKSMIHMYSLCMFIAFSNQFQVLNFFITIFVSMHMYPVCSGSGYRL